MASRSGRATRVLLLAAGLVGAACASSRWQIDAAAAPGVDLAGYVSFGWQAPPTGEAREDAPLPIADANLRSATRKQLVARGYRETDVDPDLRIGFETDTRLVETTAPSPRVGVGVGSWGGSIGTTVGASVPVGGDRVSSRAATRVTIRAVDPKSRQEVWQGTASGELDPGVDPSAVDDLVARLLEDFPASRR